MKAKLLTFGLFGLFAQMVFASFPVETQKEEVANEIIVVDEVSNDASQLEEVVIENMDNVETPAAASGYDKWVAAALWFVLGAFAAHRWYAKKPTGWNILFILTLGGFFIWSIVDIVNILTDNFVK